MLTAYLTCRENSDIGHFNRLIRTLLLKEALEKAKRDAKVLKTSFLPPVRKGHAVEAIASSQLSCI